MEFDRAPEKSNSNDQSKAQLSLVELSQNDLKQKSPVERVAIGPKSGDSFEPRPPDFPTIPGMPGGFPPGGGYNPNGGWPGGGWDGGVFRTPIDPRTYDPRYPDQRPDQGRDRDRRPDQGRDRDRDRDRDKDRDKDPYCPPSKPDRPGPGSFGPITAADPLSSKVGRELLVVGGGVGESFLYGIANVHRRLPEIGTSMAIGAGLSAITKSGQAGAAAAGLVGVYFAARFLANAVNDTERWDRAYNALTDTWNSSEHTTRNMHEFSLTAGNFAFDTTLSMGAGYIGYTNKPLADLIFQILRFPVPMPTPIPNTPGGGPGPRAPEPRFPLPGFGPVPMLLEIAPPQGSLPWPNEIIPDWRKNYLERLRHKSMLENAEEKVEGKNPNIEFKVEDHKAGATAEKPAENKEQTPPKPEANTKANERPPLPSYNPNSRFDFVPFALQKKAQ